MLKKDAKIAIIGGGVAGATTAIKLGQLGMSVTLLKKSRALFRALLFVTYTLEEISTVKSLMHNALPYSNSPSTFYVSTPMLWIIDQRLLLFLRQTKAHPKPYFLV